MALTPGDPAPLFVARSNVNPRFAFDTVAGRNIVLTFVESSTTDQGYLQELASSPLFDDDYAALFIVSQKPEDEEPEQLPLRIPGVRAFLMMEQSPHFMDLSVLKMARSASFSLLACKLSVSWQALLHNMQSTSSQFYKRHHISRISHRCFLIPLFSLFHTFSNRICVGSSFRDIGLMAEKTVAL